ncbi:MAG: bifunctional phosphoglucose/phosphomannose isomerase [Thermoprotei archaeon]|nr:MAG: bifunctional phosphoglucose/phosphomannose isomerase [Thermoprotei archaeon]
MYEMYNKWGDIVKETLKQEVINARSLSHYRDIAIVGMGGSGIIGDYLQVLAYGSPRRIFVIKDISLPQWINKSVLVIAISYSGNTIETLSAFYQAIDRGCEVAVVASGGKLLEMATKYGVMHITISKGLVPRAAFPALLYGALKILWSGGITDIITEEDAKKALTVLNSAPAMNRSQQIAEFIEDYVPVIIADTRYAPLALRFKNEINENAKMPVKVEVLPEWAHNDIVGWELGSEKFRFLLINPNDNSLYQKFIEFAESYFKSLGFSVYKLGLEGSTLFEKLMHGTIIAGFTSLLLAERRGVNPLITESITMYKEFIKKIFKN